MLSPDEKVYVQICTKEALPPDAFTGEVPPSANGTVAVAKTTSSGNEGMLLTVGFLSKSSVFPNEGDLERIARELAGVLSNIK